MADIYFSHANGFPAKSYNAMFQHLKPFEVSYIEKIGHSFANFDGKIESLVEEHIRKLELTQTCPVIGIGHSSGGIITLLAAAKRPELFSSIILLDPPIFRTSKRLLSRLGQIFGLDRYLGPANLAKKRRVEFSSRQEVLESYAQKPVFKNFNAQCLLDYVTYGFEESLNGVCLSFSNETEYKIFRLSQILQLPLKQLSVKGTIIYGKKSSLFSQSDASWWKSNSDLRVIPFDGGHLFPFESPIKTSRLLKQLIEN